MSENLDMLLDKYEKYISSNNNNSYKYVLGLSLILLKPDENIIKFDEVAEEVVKIYFRNIFKYGLIERNKSQIPIVEQNMRTYFDEIGDRVELDKKDIKKLKSLVVNNKSNGFFKNVLPCFTGAVKDERGYYIYPSQGENEFFSYCLNDEIIILTDSFFDLINKKYYLIKYITIEAYVKYLEKRNPDIENIRKIINYY